MAQPQILWRTVYKATMDTLRGISGGQYHIGLGTRGVEEFFAGLPRVPSGSKGGYDIEVPVAAVTDPISVPPTIIKVAYIGDEAARKDWRLPSQRPGTAYPLWQDGTGLLDDVEPGRDHIVLVRDPEGAFHARWLSGDQAARLPDSLLERFASKATGVTSLEPSEWEAVATTLSIPGGGAPAPAATMASTTVGEAYRHEPEAFASQQAEPFEIDPDAVDRGNVGHRKTQNALADHLLATGREPLSYQRGVDPPFDLAWRENGTLYVVEVKSLTPANEERQMRLGLGQVLRYAHQLRAHEASVVAVLAVEREPEDSTWADCCDSLGVLLSWPGVFPE